MKTKAIYAVIICAIIAGGNGLLIKSMSSLTAGSIAWFRTIVPVVFLLPTILDASNPLVKGNYKKMLLASAINAIRIYFYLVAFIFTSIGNAVVIFYLWPIFVTLFSVFVLKQKMEKRQLLLVFLGFLGLIIAYSDKSFSFGNRDFIGMLAALLSSIGYAITVLIFKSEADNFSKEQIIVYQNLIGGLVFVPFLMVLPEALWSHIGIAIFYALLVGIVVFKLFFFGLKNLSASTASSLMYLELVSAILLGYFILNETMTLNTIFGGGLIILSSFLITRMAGASNDG